MTKLSHWVRGLMIAACAFAVLLGAGDAQAYGRIDWGGNTVRMRSNKESWQIEIKIFLPKAPDFAHMPMKFEFQPTVYYERAMVDGDQLVERKVPLTNTQAIVESVDVGFLDPRSGEIQQRTKFAFKVTRGHGFEAGEYRVTVRDGRNGQVIGTPTKLIFGGENPIIDRRSIVFSGEKKAKKDDKMKKVDKDEAEKGDEAEGADTGEAAEDADEPAPPANETPDFDEPEPDPEGEIKEKPGGCGCRVPGGSTPAGGGLVLALGLIGGLTLRRRRAA